MQLLNFALKQIKYGAINSGFNFLTHQIMNAPTVFTHSMSTFTECILSNDVIHNPKALITCRDN